MMSPAVLAFMCEYISTQEPSLTRLFDENHVCLRGADLCHNQPPGVTKMHSLGEDKQLQLYFSLSCRLQAVR